MATFNGTNADEIITPGSFARQDSEAAVLGRPNGGPDLSDGWRGGNDVIAWSAAETDTIRGGRGSDVMRGGVPANACSSETRRRQRRRRWRFGTDALQFNGAGTPALQHRSPAGDGR